MAQNKSTPQTIRHITLKSKKKSFEDLVFKKSGFKKCIQCGRCTASCPAAYLYPDYNPRDLMRHFIFGEIHIPEIKEVIWKCGQCYSCRARCPRNSKAGLGVLALQTESVRQGQAPPEILGLEKKVKNNLYYRGESFLPSTLNLENFQEKTRKHWQANTRRRERLGFTAEDSRSTPLPRAALEEIRKIMELTGSLEKP
jgi:heterodisulfide reductase subunit C